MTTRNEIYAALFALASTGEGLPGKLTWPGGGALAYTSRRVRMFDDLPAKPALCQIEPIEEVQKVRGTPYTLILHAEWWVFHEVGASSAAVPTIADNDIMDAIQTVLTAPPYGDPRITLGDLVYDVYIEGTVLKVAGDIEGQALITVPIKILVP